MCFLPPKLHNLNFSSKTKCFFVVQERRGFIFKKIGHVLCGITYIYGEFGLLYFKMMLKKGMFGFNI